jgi:hypothetical protein
MQTMPDPYSQKVSRILWAKCFKNRPPPSALFSGFGAIRLLAIRIREVLSEGIFQSFEKALLDAIHNVLKGISGTALRATFRD